MSDGGRYSMRASTRQRSVDREMRSNSAASSRLAAPLSTRTGLRKVSPETRTGISARGAPPTSRSTAYGGRDVHPPEGLSSHVTRAPAGRLLGAAVASSRDRSDDAPLQAVAEDDGQERSSTTHTDETPLGDDQDEDAECEHDDDDEDDDEEEEEDDGEIKDKDHPSEASEASHETPLGENSRPTRHQASRIIDRLSYFGRLIASAWKGICVLFFSALVLSAVQQAYIPSLGVPGVDLSRVPDLLGYFPSPGPIFNSTAGTGAPIYHGISSWQFDRLASRVNNLETSLTSLSRSVRHKSPLRRVNFFASGSGVIIDPYLTSPTRPFKFGSAALLTAPRSYIDIIRRRPSSLLPRSGPGPASVFRPWDDAGECWCSPQGGGKSQIAMVLPRPVIPQELIVEHIPESATLDPAAMPQDLEFWVQLDDPDARAKVTNAALEAVQTDDALFKSKASAATDDYATKRALDESWVRVGRWTFQRAVEGSSDTAQGFRIPVHLDELAVPVSRVVVRTTSSWGEENSVCIYRLKLHGMVAEELPQRGP